MQVNMVVGFCKGNVHFVQLLDYGCGLGFPDVMIDIRVMVDVCN